MAITLPVYTQASRQSITPGGTAERPLTAIKIRVSGDGSAEGDSPGIARGLIVGVNATTGATPGVVTVRVYSDVSKTDELYNVDLAMTLTPFKSSNMLAQGIPFYSPPYFTIQCTANPGEAVFVTFYIKSIAGNG